MLLQKSKEFKIKLNAKDKNGQTAFHLACKRGYTSIVKIMIENSDSIRLGLRDNDGKTGFQLAQGDQKTDIINLIK